MTARIKRVYEEAEASDGYRVLVDRLWPRGVSKERAEIDEWLKDVAPSPDLRTWFGHRPERFEEFAERYAAELDGSPALEHLRELVGEHDTVTLVIAAKDPEHNHGLVLLDQL
ncbi:probable uroporphyrin-III c-methyltransferase [Actinomycetales bacterium JB111]|nr:probable uroporphyrin-III c-methyltransferase [Actinomycetales bacterium JB111]